MCGSNRNRRCKPRYGSSFRTRQGQVDMQRELVVVEDSDDDYDAFVRTCRSIGFAGQLRRFADAEAALTFLRAVDWGSASTIRGTVPGLILLDLNLPGMDGRDLL